MSQLANFPLLNQNADVGEVNHAFDCVPTCIASSLIYLLGKDYDPGAIKDIVYGRSYVGGTDAAQYVEYCASQGVRLYQITGTPSALIAQVHTLLADGAPSIITIPDPYMPASSGWTHAETFHADGTGTLTALDPYVGKDITKSDTEWGTLLVGNTLWVLTKEAMTMVPSGWHDANGVLTAPNGHKVVHGFRDWVLSHNWDPANWPLMEEYGMQSLEDSNPSLGAGTQQVFKWSMLGWTQSRGVFLEWLGVELVYDRQKVAQYYSTIKQQSAQLQTLQTDLATAQQQATQASTYQQQAQAAEAQVATLTSQVQQLQQEIAQLQAQPAQQDPQLLADVHQATALLAKY